MKTVIGILYICTGPYHLFWKDFYNTFEKKFLPNTEKIYFVFTDAEKIYGEGDKKIKIYKIKNQPWPLITLLRFNTFLTGMGIAGSCSGRMGLWQKKYEKFQVLRRLGGVRGKGKSGRDI